MFSSFTFHNINVFDTAGCMHYFVLVYIKRNLHMAYNLNLYNWLEDKHKGEAQSFWVFIRVPQVQLNDLQLL